MIELRTKILASVYSFRYPMNGMSLDFPRLLSEALIQIRSVRRYIRW